MHEAAARRAGLSGTDQKYLGFLAQSSRMTAGQLAELSGLTTGAVTGMIDRFEKKKLVKRRFAPDDRRKVIIGPDTGRIIALLSPLCEEFRKKTDELAKSLSKKEIAVVGDYFTRAIGIIEETTLILAGKKK